jgi:hypothetical protein
VAEPRYQSESVESVHESVYELGRGRHAVANKKRRSKEIQMDNKRSER